MDTVTSKSLCMDTVMSKSPGVDTAMARHGYSDASFPLHRILHRKVRNVENLRGKIRAFVLVCETYFACNFMISLLISLSFKYPDQFSCGMINFSRHIFHHNPTQIFNFTITLYLCYPSPTLSLMST